MTLPCQAGVPPLHCIASLWFSETISCHVGEDGLQLLIVPPSVSEVTELQMYTSTVKPGF